MVFAFLIYKFIEAGYLLKNITVLALQCQIYILYKLFPFPIFMTTYDILERVLYMNSDGEDTESDDNKSEED